MNAGWVSNHMVGIPTTSMETRQDGWNSNHLQLLNWPITFFSWFLNWNDSHGRQAVKSNLRRQFCLRQVCALSLSLSLSYLIYNWWLKLNPQYWTNHSAKMSLPSLPALSAKEKAKLWLENRKSIAPKRHQGKHEVPGSRPKVLNNYYRYEHILFVEDFM